MSRTTYDSFLAIADTSRREILMMLTKEKKSINSIADSFNISRPAISKHIKVLADTGFINIENKGRERVCSLNSKGFEEIQNWVNYFEKFWTKELGNLEMLLKKNEEG